MKKNKLLIIVTIALVGVVNLLQPFQNAKACDPWDPNWNFLTGECDPPYYNYEAPAQGSECLMWYYDETYGQVYIPTGTYATDCEWAVVGSCTPEDC